METCDIIVILSFLDFRWNHLATTNYGAQKFQQSVHIPLFCWSLVRLNLNHSHGCFASGGGEAYTSGQGSYLGKRGKPPYQLYHYYLFPFVYYSRTQHNLNEMKCRSSLPFCGLDVFWSLSRGFHIFYLSVCTHVSPATLHQMHKKVCPWKQLH